MPGCKLSPPPERKDWKKRVTWRQEKSEWNLYLEIIINFKHRHCTGLLSSHCTGLLYRTTLKGMPNRDEYRQKKMVYATQKSGWLSAVYGSIYAFMTRPGLCLDYIHKLAGDLLYPIIDAENVVIGGGGGGGRRCRNCMESSSKTQTTGRCLWLGHFWIRVEKTKFLQKIRLSSGQLRLKSSMS